MKFAGKTILITGGGSGIGAEIARSVARDGGAAVIADVNPADDVVDGIRSGGGRAAFVRTDVSEDSSVRAALAFAVSEFGGLDGAVNNAGVVQESVYIHETPDDLWERVQKVNATSVFYCLRAQISYFLENDRPGAIVNTASASGISGTPGLGSYVASKHAVVGLTRTAAKEYVRNGIRVNAIAPVTVDTPMITAMAPELRKAITESLMMGRMASVKEVAAAATFLLCDEASYINGLVLPIDGGKGA